MPWERMLAYIAGRRNAETRTLKRDMSIHMVQGIILGISQGYSHRFRVRAKL